MAEAIISNRNTGVIVVSSYKTPLGRNSEKMFDVPFSVNASYEIF